MEPSQNQQSYETVKIVVVGDGDVGKTCAILCYAGESFPTNYFPTVYDVHKGVIPHKSGREVELFIHDTAGQDDLARLRPLAYNDCDVFVVCFAVNDM